MNFEEIYEYKYEIVNTLRINDVEFELMLVVFE